MSVKMLIIDNVPWVGHLHLLWLLGPRRGICNLFETYCQIPRVVGLKGEKGNWNRYRWVDYGLEKKNKNLKQPIERKKGSENQI